MFDIGGAELLLIILAFILLFGPKKIPEVLQMFGKGMSHVRKAQQQFREQIDEISIEIKDVVDVDSIQKLKHDLDDIRTGRATYDVKKANPQILTDTRAEPEGLDTLDPDEPAKQQEFKVVKPKQPIVSRDSNATTISTENDTGSKTDSPQG